MKLPRGRERKEEREEREPYSFRPALALQQRKEMLVCSLSPIEYVR
jgi:hypothetical protein